MPYWATIEESYTWDIVLFVQGDLKICNSFRLHSLWLLIHLLFSNHDIKA